MQLFELFFGRFKQIGVRLQCFQFGVQNVLFIHVHLQRFASQRFANQFSAVRLIEQLFRRQCRLFDRRCSMADIRFQRKVAQIRHHQFDAHFGNRLKLFFEPKSSMSCAHRIYFNRIIVHIVEQRFRDVSWIVLADRIDNYSIKNKDLKTQ